MACLQVVCTLIWIFLLKSVIFFQVHVCIIIIVKGVPTNTVIIDSEQNVQYVGSSKTDDNS